MEVMCLIMILLDLLILIQKK